ncbi:MAG: lytic transglycosylase domain-containing protein [bacterium]
MKKKLIICFTMIYFSLLKPIIANQKIDYSIFQNKDIQKEVKLLKKQIIEERKRMGELIEVIDTAVICANKLKLINPRLNREDSISYGNSIEKYCRLRNLDHNLVIAIIAVESGVNPNAVSKANAVGLMQVRPDVWAKALGIKSQNFFDPDTNINLGTFILARYITRFGGIIEAVTAYNHGKDVGTCEYTNKVLRMYWKIRELSIAKSRFVLNN